MLTASNVIDKLKKLEVEDVVNKKIKDNAEASFKLISKDLENEFLNERKTQVEIVLYEEEIFHEYGEEFICESKLLSSKYGWINIKDILKELQLLGYSAKIAVESVTVDLEEYKVDLETKTLICSVKM